MIKEPGLLQMAVELANQSRLRSADADSCSVRFYWYESYVRATLR
jgi:hypothetical protein